jgi:iron complex outermembrane recepter protein
MKLKAFRLDALVGALALAGLAGHALAQSDQRIVITGSSIKRIASEGALPVQTITRAELTREGISSTEQLVMALTVNGTGLDNLASNADVVDGAARGNNGATSANLRGQGSNATLVLLNGRRVASHGLNGGQVDLNQIPFAAIERIEILKDGASAIYGTDAVGGVINFITRRDFTGFTAETFVDVTEQGGGNIYKGAVTAGFGNLETQRFNVMATLAYSENKALRGDQRDFTNTNQPNRGLSPDTRGTPHATIVPLGATTVNGVVTQPASIIPSAATAPLIPGTTVRAGGGINVLDLPGGPGCNAIDGMFAYNDALWAAPDRQLACSWDTGRAAVIQQPVKNISLLTRGSLRLGEHLLSAEFTASQVDSAKRFSNIQLLPSTGLTPLRYPSTGAAYNDIINRLTTAFPGFTPVAGAPISYRWRCAECGPREIKTEAETQRAFVGIEGPVFGWDYRAGVSQATSEVKSTLGSGYIYRRSLNYNGQSYSGIVEALNTGVINPFLLPGQTQSQAALDLIRSTSAAGVVLYGGKFTTNQVDATVSGPLFKLPGGDLMAAVGADFRQEKYKFTGDERPAIAGQPRPDIIGAPFDDGNALPGGVKRDIKAVFTEVLLPLAKWAELTLAVRRDDYTGFGSTTNPKVSGKIKPSETFFIRGSYNEAFRVPTFNQIFNGTISQQYLGSDVADPATCPPPSRPIAGNPNCQVPANLSTLSGGTANLGPETAKQYLYGFVYEPFPAFSVSVDWWSIERENQIRVPSIQLLLENYALFTDRFIRDGSGALVAIDQRWINTGGSKTKGIEVGIRGNGKVAELGGSWAAGMDISYLKDKRSRVTQNAPWGLSEVGINTLSGDLGIRWKHNLWGTYTQGDWSATLLQQFRSGYRDRSAPGVANGTVRPVDYNPRVDDYVLHNVSVSWTGIKNLTVTGGIKNIANEDPPFSYTYDDVTGAGGAWEPRLADPRGRSFTLKVEYKFF